MALFRLHHFPENSPKVFQLFLTRVFVVLDSFDKFWVFRQPLIDLDNVVHSFLTKKLDRHLPLVKIALLALSKKVLINDLSLYAAPKHLGVK